MAFAPTSPASREPAVGDRAGARFWDEWWQRSSLPPPIDPCRRGLKNYPFRKLHEFFEAVFSDRPARGQRLIEIGAAQSVWLPYFAKQFGFKVAGLDRSELGCQRARMVLEREHVAGEIRCGDLFSPPTDWVYSFDVCGSFGVVEHFENTAQVIAAIARFLKPEGRMITLIPNFTGILRAYQRRLDRALCDAHLPLDLDQLAAAHREAGLRVEACDYLLPLGLEVLNVEKWPRRLPYWIVVRVHGVISRFVWLLDDAFHFRPNRWSSPYIYCVARKLIGIPDDAAERPACR
ncbi:MAG TPA: methyltransferase domain-containing protein [Terriglobia bacterium]|nr:methyltransferase domain-containing protein [Terriglobia bacterium]